MLDSFRRVFRHRISFWIWIIATLGMIYIWYIFSNIEYVAANYQSHAFAYFDTFLSWCVIFLFPLLIAGIVYRSILFGRESHGKKSPGVIGFFSGIIGVFVTGASCCGVTLVSIFGLSSVVTFLQIFPYHGIELKVLSILILIYVVHDLYRNIDSCKVTPQKKNNLRKKISEK